MDHTYPEINATQFPACDFQEFCVVVEEPIPYNSPEAIGKKVNLCLFEQ